MLFWAASSPRTQPQPLHLLNPHHRIVFQWLQGTYVAWKLSILRPMKPLKWEHHSSMTTYTAVEYMAWFKIKSVTVRFSHCAFSLHCTSCSFIVSILVGEFLMVGRYPMIYFFCGCFRSFTENFHAWKICFLPLLLCRGIFKTISWCFDIKLSNWLRLFSKFWIDNRFGRWILIYGSEVWDTFPWNSCLL